jgi:hypothetical protein
LVVNLGKFEFVGFMKTLNVMPKALATAIVALGAMATPSLAGTFSGTYGFGTNTTNIFTSPDANATLAATESQTGMPANVIDFAVASKGSGVANVPLVGTTGTVSGVGNPGRALVASGWGDYAAFGLKTGENTTTDYFQFSINAPSAGNAITKITNVSFDAVRLLGGPTAWNLKADIGGAITDLGTGSIGTGLNGANWGSNAITAAFLSALPTNITQAITFRLYASGATNIAGTLGVDNFKVDGTAIPTPAAIPAMIAFGAGLWRKRKQETEVAAD